MPMSLKPLPPVEGVRNPEDFTLLEGTPWVLTSGTASPGYAGGLFAVDSSEPLRAAPLQWSDGGRQVAGQGLTARRRDDGAFDVVAIDHHGGEAVLMLVVEVGSDGPVVVGSRRIDAPDGTSGDGVAFFGDGLLYTSQFDPRQADTMRRFTDAEPTGWVWRWDPRSGWDHFGDQPWSGANGIVVDASQTVVHACEWAASRIWRLDADGRRLDAIDVDFLPDNLNRDGDRLLVAGQRSTTERVHDCLGRGTPCPGAFAVGAIDPASSAFTALYSGEGGADFGGATGALRVGDEYWLSSFMGTTLGRLGPVASSATENATGEE